MGVLCRVAELEEVKGENIVAFRKGNNPSESYGLPDGFKVISHGPVGRLVDMNDGRHPADQKSSFKEIADWIEEHLVPEGEPLR